MIKTCPAMNAHFRTSAATITLDSGAEADLMRRDVAIAIGAKIEKTNQSSTQADGVTPLLVSGEVHVTFSRDGRPLHFSGLVVDNLDVEVLFPF